MSNAFDLVVSALREQGLNSNQILEELSVLFQKLVDSDKDFGTDESKEKKIRRVVDMVCMPKHIKGYRYWVEAICYYMECEVELKMIAIYDYVAQKCGDTPANTERAMRYAVEKVFNECPKDIRQIVFGNKISSKANKPTILQFMTALLEQI